MSILKPSCTPVAAFQITPQTILFVVTHEDFKKSLQILNRYNITLRFLEERKSGLDVHVSLIIQKFPVEVTFRIIDYTFDFVQEIVKIFPNASVFIQEIEEVDKIP